LKVRILPPQPRLVRVPFGALAEERSGQAVEPIKVRLELDDGMSLTTLVTPLGGGTYRLEETEWMAELYHHDIIQAEDLGSSSLRCIRVAQRSELLLRSGIFSKDFLDSAEDLAEWSGGEVVWQGDDLAVIRATYD